MGMRFLDLTPEFPVCLPSSEDDALRDGAAVKYNAQRRCRILCSPALVGWKLVRIISFVLALHGFGAETSHDD